VSTLPLPALEALLDAKKATHATIPTNDIVRTTPHDLLFSTVNTFAIDGHPPEI